MRLFDGTLEEFQDHRGGARIRALRQLRQLTLARADRLFTPSRYLARIVAGWGIRGGEVGVIPNPAPLAPNGIARDDLRRRLGMSGPTYVFAGRLVPQKNVALAVAALRVVPGASLVLVGDGEDAGAVRAAIARHGLEDRVRLAGAMARADGMQWVRAADAAVLPSDWENFPHAAVEAFAVGTPVIATAVGGVPEIVEPGYNGLLVDRGDEAGLASAMAAVAGDSALRDRLARGAAESASRFTTEAAFGAIERELLLAAGR
jgi:glycosyltransferase involved in cell wall biosynthesis